MHLKKSERRQCVADFLPVYLICGEDELKREFVMERLVKRMSALGDLDFNRDNLLGPGTTADELIGACNTLPFMSEKRLVQVKEADKLPKATQEALVDYLADPCQTTVLALIATKLAKNTRLYRAIAKVDKKAIISCEPKGKRDLPSQVQSIAASHQLQISLPAANELIAMVGESTVHIDTELRKLASALGPGAQVTEQHLHQYVTRVSEVKPWELADAVVERNGRKVAVLLSRMTSQSPFGLLTMTLNRLRELLVTKDFERMGNRNTNALASELGQQEWKVRDHFRKASRFTQEELEAAIISGAELEGAMKSGGDPNMLFERWALEICSH